MLTPFPGRQEAATDDMQVAALIGFRACPDGDCSTFDPATDGVGPNIVFAGAFTPAHDPNQPQKGLFQDFTFQIPAGSAIGDSVFSLGHLQAVGVSAITCERMLVKWCTYLGCVYAGEQRPSL